jgi:hypothetical protein
VLLQIVVQLVTNAAAGIGEGLTSLGNELPVIALGVKRQFQDAEGVGVPRLAIRFRLAKSSVRIFPAASDNKLANASISTITIRILGRELNSGL